MTKMTKGRSHWIAQRVSALLLVFVLGAMALTLPVLDSVLAWRAWLASLQGGGMMLVLLALLWWHWQCGMRVIVDDYMPAPFAPMARMMVRVTAWFFALLGAAAIAAIMMTMP